jgi:hypothetical protein
LSTACPADLWQGFSATLTIRLNAADTVISLTSRPGCLRGLAQRRLRHGGGQHGAVGVYDRITWNFVRYIAGYRRRMAPRVRQLIAAHATHADVVVLRDRRAVRRYLAGVAASVSTVRVASAGEGEGLICLPGIRQAHISAEGQPTGMVFTQMTQPMPSTWRAMAMTVGRV